MVLCAIERRVCEHLSWVPSLQRSRVILCWCRSHNFLEERTRAAGPLHTASFLETAIENLLEGGRRLELLLNFHVHLLLLFVI